MSERFILALDQGTAMSRCIVFNRDGRAVAKAARDIQQIYPQPGWVEHDPAEIWDSQMAVVKEAMAAARIGPDAIAALGIANQRETVVVWDRDSGRPVHNAIVWQCRRTLAMCARMRHDGLEPGIVEKTGLNLDPYFSGTKLKWILDNVPSARERARDGRLLFGTVDSWLVWKLTGGRVHATDHTNASRTMLFNIHTLDWDDELLALFNIPRRMLPEVGPSSHVYGDADAPIMGAEVPIAGVAGDQQAALFGQLCWNAGGAKNTYGTGCFLLMNTGKKAVRSRSGLITTVAATTGTRVDYALEGSIFSGGDMLLWLRDELGLIGSAADSEALAAGVRDTAGVHVVPAFVGLGAPYWNSRVRGTVTGLGHLTRKAHIVRAVLESIAYQTLDVLKAMEQDAGTSVGVLKADGGASSNNFLMQFQADIMDRQVVRPDQMETTALGAAYLAGLAVGYWRDREEVRLLWRDDTMFSSGMPEETRARLVAGWRKTIDTALYWSR